MAAEEGNSRVLQEHPPLLAPCIVTARLDLGKLRAIREKMPIDKHRRGDLFVVKEAATRS